MARKKTRKDIFGPMFQAILQREMNSHLGYQNNERGEKESSNRRNGYTSKTIKTTAGDVPIQVPRDRDGTFEPVYETKNYAVYVIPGYDTDGKKDILGLWLSEAESKHQWMQIFDEIKSPGVEDGLFISMDGVSGLDEGAKAIFPDVTVQRCIVHLIRNSIKYVPNKDYKRFTAQLKKVYGVAA